MRRKILLLARIVVYLLASVVPSVLVGVVGVKAGLADRYEGPPATSEFRSGELPAPPGHDPDKPTAVVLLSNRGSEVTDVLAPYEVLSESGAFNVYAAAPKREAATLSGASTSCRNSRSRSSTGGLRVRTRTWSSSRRCGTSAPQGTGPWPSGSKNTPKEREP